MPIVMATGSGKTYTTGIHIRNMFIWRDALERIQKKEIPLNILILNDRTNLVDQLEKANIDGKWWYEPHFGADILDHARVKVFHSKADKKQILNTNNEVVEIDGEDTIQEFGQGKKDNIYFSTFQSINKFVDEDLVFDVIMIDEAHHLKASSYKSVVQEYVDKYEARNWRKPLIIPMSATPDGVMNQVDPVINFTLAQHLASPYSPEVDYHLVTSTDFTNDDLEFVNTEICRIQSIDDIREKIKEIKTLKWYIEKHLAQFGWLKELTQDMISRVMENAGSLDHTIIFAPSINDVDAITAQINELTGDDNTAVWFHSKIDEADKTILDWYESGKHKIIVAVDKLNEGIDMPETRNVIFRRWTNSSRVFQQQFGRGLRGKKVSFYDYTGTMANFSWIWDINQQVQDIQDQKDSDQWDGEIRSESWISRTRKGIDVLFGNVWGFWIDANIKQVELTWLISWIMELDQIKDYNEMTRDECTEHLKQQLVSFNTVSISQLLNLWPTWFQKKFGLSLIWKILGEKIDRVSIDHLKILADVLKLPQVSEQQKQEFRDLLRNNGPSIVSTFQLLNFGSTEFEKTFGVIIIWQILGETFKGITLDHLKRLAKVLELTELTQELKENLAAINVTSTYQLLDFGPTNFRQKFRLFLIWQILGEKIDRVSIDHLKRLAKVLELTELTQELKENLAAINVTSTYQLLKLWPVWFKHKFGLFLIWQILGERVRPISLDHLKRLANVLELP